MKLLVSTPRGVVYGSRVIKPTPIGQGFRWAVVTSWFTFRRQYEDRATALQPVICSKHRRHELATAQTERLNAERASAAAPRYEIARVVHRATV